MWRVRLAMAAETGGFHIKSICFLPIKTRDQPKILTFFFAHACSWFYSSLFLIFWVHKYVQPTRYAVDFWLILTRPALAPDVTEYR